MEKLATPDEVLAHIRRMPIEDREYVEAELLRDGYESGRLAEPPTVMVQECIDGFRSRSGRPSKPRRLTQLASVSMPRTHLHAGALLRQGHWSA